MQLKELYQFGKESLSLSSIETPALEASLLLSQTTIIDSTCDIYTFPEMQVNQYLIDNFQELLNRRIKREPIAYITGEKEFYSRSFKVNSNVLIPRAETELLVDKALELLKNTGSPLILEIGTGSGCIATTLACEYEDAEIIATDISKEALSVAKENITNYNQFNRITLIRADLLSTFKYECFDLVISNPPYITAEDFSSLEDDVKDYEPRLALQGGHDGLQHIRGIISNSTKVLKDKGWCILEIGYDQGGSVQDLFHQHGFIEISTTKDLNGVERVIKAKWKK